VISALLLLFDFAAVHSALHERITNRRYISHVLYEERSRKPSLTLVTTHPRYWAYKADSHQLYLTCDDTIQCLEEMKKLNQHLRSGFNIKLTLNGSQIVKLQYLKSD
jgi:hypothetical protein